MIPENRAIEKSLRKPYRVLYIQPYNWECGPHQSLLSLVSNLDRKSYSATVILPTASAIAQEFLRLGVPIYFDRGVQTVPRSFSPFRQLAYMKDLWMSARRLAQLIRSKNIHLVHVNSEACWVGGLAASLARVPAITHLRGLSVLSPILVGRFTAWVLNCFNQALIATSCEVKQAFLRNGVASKLLFVIHNGVNIETFSPDAHRANLRSELGIGNGQPLIGMIANFDPRKGHHYFVQACRIVVQRIPDARFVLIGDTSLAGGKEYFLYVKHLAQRYDIENSIYFLGLRRDIPSILASVDLVVQPSLTEAGPRVPIEAMAMECPIIVTNVGGNSEEVIDGKTGLVVPVGEVESLASAIIRLLYDPKLRLEMGKAGRLRVIRMFSDTVHMRKVVKLYKKLIDENKHTAAKSF